MNTSASFKYFMMVVTSAIPMMAFLFWLTILVGRTNSNGFPSILHTLMIPSA